MSSYRRLHNRCSIQNMGASHTTAWRVVYPILFCLTCMHNLIKQMERMSFKVINYKKDTIEVGENKAFKMPISFFFFNDWKNNLNSSGILILQTCYFIMMLFDTFSKFPSCFVFPINEHVSFKDHSIGLNWTIHDNLRIN